MILGFVSCSDDNELVPNPFVIAFENTFSNFARINDTPNIQLIFSESVESSGFVKIRVENTESVYGVDYITNPSVENGSIILPFSAGDTSLNFEFTSLLEELNQEDSDKAVNFIIEEINFPGDVSIQGYTQHKVSFSDLILNNAVAPEVGGPNQQNQVYFDLSTGEYKNVVRDSWDLGFYSGDDFRVVLNSSIYMVTKSLEVTDIDAITRSNIPSSYFNEVMIGTFDAENIEYVDNPSGDITDTAIDEIVVEPTDNQVYLVNLGYEVGTTTPNTGSVAVAGNARGWKKIRVLRQDGGYLLQYADLDETTHSEIFIPKTPEYNFNHFSFDSEDVLQVQPPKEQWDICFTVFTNVIYTTAGELAGSYGFSDYVITNVLSETGAFMVMQNNGITYENYELNLAEATAQLSYDQRAIGENWRDVFNGLNEDRFFVINDANGNWYKLRFLAFVNEAGERGHPRIQYELLY